MPTSEVSEVLLSNPPEGGATLAWMMNRLGERSFGVALLLLALLGLLPGVSPIAGVLLLVLAIQMIRGRHRPILPRRVAGTAFETRLLSRLIRRVVPVLRWLERFICPRWATPFQSTKCVVGGVVLLLGVGLLLTLPLSNAPPALLIGLIAFAYLEEDGALLLAALTATLVMFTVAAAIAWETLGAAGLVPSLF